MKNVKITKAGYVKINNVKVLEEKLTPISLGKFVSKVPESEESLRLWVSKNYRMC